MLAPRLRTMWTWWASCQWCGDYIRSQPGDDTNWWTSDCDVNLGNTNTILHIVTPCTTVSQKLQQHNRLCYEMILVSQHSIELVFLLGSPQFWSSLQGHKKCHEGVLYPTPKRSSTVRAGGFWQVWVAILGWSLRDMAPASCGFNSCGSCNGVSGQNGGTLFPQRFLQWQRLIHLPKAKQPIWVLSVPKYWLEDDGTMCLDETHRWRSADTIAWLRTHGLHSVPNWIKAEIGDLVYNRDRGRASNDPPPGLWWLMLPMSRRLNRELDPVLGDMWAAGGIWCNWRRPFFSWNIFWVGLFTVLGFLQFWNERPFGSCNLISWP